MSEWQTIESAPKDGTEFLGAWVSIILKGWFIQPVKFLNGSFVVTWDHEEVDYVTHWMPLPNPPKDAE